jgi:hypothetical protein
MSSVPPWPSTPAPVGTFADRLIPWSSLMAPQPPWAFAEAYAWLADSGRLDVLGHQVGSRLVGGSPWSALWRRSVL